MTGPFANLTYRKLFSAHVVAMIGTGLMTVALGLLAYDLAGAKAGLVLGTAYAIKMLAYVALSPVMAALATHMSRKRFLIVADLARALVALALPFVSEVWHVYVLIFALQTASASFTPVFQAMIPDILPDEDDYTRALSMSRLAYDLESMLSPALAALLLGVFSYHILFVGTVIGFLVSAALVLVSVIPPQAPSTTRRPFRQQVLRGSWIYLKTPRLRGVLALNFAVAAVGAFVLVNTVVLVRGTYGRDASDLAVIMLVHGAGSMGVALALPRLLRHLRERQVMIGAAAMISGVAMITSIAMLAGLGLPWGVILVIWALIGAGYSAVLTPVGRLLRKSASRQDLSAVFAAQFALSHACWLVTYPLAGYLGLQLGLPTTLLILAGMALVAGMVAIWIWPPGSADAVAHEHPDLPDDHPHLRAHGGEGTRHSHAPIIDDWHLNWSQKP